MALNLVTVTATFQSDQTPEGNYTFVPTGMSVDLASHVMIVPMVKQGAIPPNGLLSVPIVASDNFAADVLNWNIRLIVRGAKNVYARYVAINYSNGPTQDLWVILSNAGWTPAVTP